MGDVIGIHQSPLERAETWHTMLMLRESVNFLKQRDRNRFQSTIEKEQGIYKRQLDSFVSAA